MSEREEIECATKAWRTDDGTPVLGHVYVDIEEHDNCHVTVSKCERCGHVTVGWYHMGSPPPKWAPPEDGDVGQISRRKEP